MTPQTIAVPTDISTQPLCDVLVIGGGPAGSTVSTLLARRGHDVVLLDKDQHPRFHIGESLLPANLPLFDKLGVGEEIRAIGMVKQAAEFESPWHAHRQTFLFKDAWNKNMPHAYQVHRASFDQILLRNAARSGVRVFETCRLETLDLDADPERATAGARHETLGALSFQPRFVIDASGRDTFLANRFRIKHKNPRHSSLSIYGHFCGAQRHPGQAEGYITIFWFDHGWFWFIPLQNGITSVGMVAWPYFMKTRGGRSLEQFLLDGIAACPKLAERLAGATLARAVEATGNFSYTSERNHGRNYVMVGDAYAFIDPVFSSGVWLAMQGAVAAAEAVDTCLRKPAQSTAALRRFDKAMRHGPREFSWLIYRMTNPVMRDLLMAPRNPLRVREAVLSLLAGDIYGRTPIWASLAVFKLIYYVSSALRPGTSLRAWRQRKINIRAVDGLVESTGGVR
ncbi:MAG: tryptophan 7-halogenase [Burkholderiaceae bacterium]|jgi:flavin-dependent dehydrogenase|nr:tryptophan 7-halogenase [Burkholderiaceae bacterium]